MPIFRKIIQLAAAFLVNSAFLLGQSSPATVYQGGLKQVCSPGLNCYGCPYALTACPIGSLQHFISSASYHFSFYVAGFLMLIGVCSGRIVCGWICPFGLIQELIYKLKSPKFRFPHFLRHLPWLFLLGLVFFVPLVSGDQAYCRYLCPAGTLEGGVPFGIFSSQIRELIGPLYFYKLALLAVFLFGSVFIFRFFCRSACPLGLIYGFFNRISWLGFSFDKERCTDCGLCARSCPVDLDPARGEFRRNACIRCLKCRDVCPQNSLHFGFKKLVTAAEKNKKSALSS